MSHLKNVGLKHAYHQVKELGEDLLDEGDNKP